MYFNVDSKLLLFADETTIFSSLVILFQQLALMISFVGPFDWFASNKLSLNNYTTQAINFCLNCDLVRYCQTQLNAVRIYPRL